MYESSVYLKPEQIDKLRCVLSPKIPIYPSPPTSSFPTLNIIPKDFLRELLCKFKEHSIDITTICLHGGAASYVLIDDSDFVYRDLDILFHVKTSLSSEQQTTLFSSNNQPYSCDVWTIIKYIVSSCLIKYLPQPSTYTQYFVTSVLDTYTKKNIKISSEQDSWALLSLQNLLGQNLELKFVENIKRQWQFSVDSFQIDLKQILLEKADQQSKVQQSILTNISTKTLTIKAINGVTIINSNKTNDESTTPGPLEFGFFTPSSSPTMMENNDDNSQYHTLATITTIQASTPPEFRSRSPKLSGSPNDNDDSDSSLQFQISINEDVDDGIEADVGDSTNEDDDQQYRTPVDTDNSSTIETTNPLRIEVFSLYKDLNQALQHLNNKLIATYEAETMRGGGLLKYCDLLARNYKLYDVAIMTHMQRYMCSRFFIDYKTLREQLHVIAQYVGTHYLPKSITTSFYTSNNSNEIVQIQYYLQNHLMNSKYDSEPIDAMDLINARICIIFFDHLLAVIQQSTVCLTHEDRELLLYSIQMLQEYYYVEYKRVFQNDHQHFQRYNAYNHPHYTANSSSNSSRSTSPSNLSSKSYGSYRPHRNYRSTANSSYNQTRNNNNYSNRRHQS